MAERIMEIRISPAVEFKLRSKHQLSGDIVREAIQYPAKSRCHWQFHNIYGWRLQAFGFLDSGYVVVAYLYQIDDSYEIWSLGTAFRKVRK